MRVLCKAGDIVDEIVDVLISSGNIYLNLSGGVGGEIMHRGGKEVQNELHRYLRDKNIRHVDPGTVLQVSPGPAKAKALLYAVAVDVWYDSSVKLVAQTIVKALTMANGLGAKTAALPALATGYGHLQIEDFARALKKALKMDFPAIEEVRVVLRNAKDAFVIKDVFSTASYGGGRFEDDGEFFLVSRATHTSGANSRLIPMPERKTKLQLQRTYSQNEYQEITFGLSAQKYITDDKWFIFLEENWLYIHRNRTDICVYQVRLNKDADNYHIAEAWVNCD
jgi:O-acetyl-ADP-ribose deacetylase